MVYWLPERKGGGKEVDKDKGIKNMMTEGDLTLAGKHTMQ